MNRVSMLMFMLVLTSCTTIRRGDSTTVMSDKENERRSTLELLGDKHKPIEAANFIGDWVRGEPSEKGYYSERLIVDKQSYRYYEDGTLVMEGPTVVQDNMILIDPKVNKSRYYGKFGGCWGGLRNNGNTLDLFGNAKGMLSFDRKDSSEQKNPPDSK